MPFFDNTGLDPDVERGPLWGAFASLFGQLERLILINILWAAQAAPLLLVVMFPDWPAPLRLALALYSGLALAVATALLYALLHTLVAEDEALTMAQVRDLWPKTALSGITTVIPLYGSFGILLGIAAWAGALPGSPFALEVLARLAILLLIVASMYWGPLLGEMPRRPALAIARASAVLVWREPGKSLLLTGMTLLVMLIGIISVGGLVLVVPVLVGLLQTHMLVYIRRQKPVPE
jgi:MFS family permease